MSKQDTLIGRQLDEYKLEKLLGQGGMARVYRGIDTKLQRYVAIKVIDAQFRNDKEYTRRFEREAQAIARFNHPNIVTLYRYGNVNGLLYMAMQYIKGSDLAQLLEEYRADGEFMAAEEILRIMRDAGRGLDYVHEQGAIHRDIKPSNIMLTENGTAVIADFGLALMRDMGTRGEIFGTPNYLSPEQAISSAQVVPQSDIYSLGVILYEMFTHRLPFEKSEPMDTAMAHVNEEPPEPSIYRPDLPKPIEQVILKALAKTPYERYQSCAELADALETAIKHSSRTKLSSVPSHSIVDRVHLDMEANPLPPLPPPATPPPLVQDGKRAEQSLFERMSTQDIEIEETAIFERPVILNQRQKQAMRWLAAFSVIVALLAIIMVIRSTSGRMAPAEMTATAVDLSNRAFALLLTQTSVAVASVDSNAVATQQVVNAQATMTGVVVQAQETNAMLGTSVMSQAQQTSEALSNQQATANAQLQATAAELQAQQTNAVLSNQQAVQAQQTSEALSNQQATANAQAQQTSVALSNQQATANAQLQAQQTSIALSNQQATANAQVQPTSAPAQAQPTFTAVPQATNTVSSQPTPAPATGGIVVLIIYTDRDRALRIVRPAGQSISTPVEIAALVLIRAEDDERLRDDNSGNDPANPRQLIGANWTTVPPRLLSGECFDILKSSNETPVGSVNCTDQGDYITVNEENKTWDGEFNVYYNGFYVSTCEKNETCIVQIPVSG